ncbi:MAG: polyphosphate kinase 1, partial [Gemmatimonadota bacterium]
MTNLRVQPSQPRGATPVDLRHTSYYLNRELSWLEFNRRVLWEGLDSRNPLLERLKFLAIFSSNLDEFIQVRVAGLKQQHAAGYSERTADGMTVEDQLSAISALVRGMQRQHSECLIQEILPGLAAAGIHVLNMDQISDQDREYLEHYFHTHVFPVLTPLAVDPAHPFPYISNLSLSLAVVLRDADGEEHFARVKVPKILPRWVPLAEANRFVPLEQLIAANLETLFPGIEILGSYTFRVTRNTEYEIDHDEAEDLLSLIQEEVRNRRFGEVTRLEVHPSMPAELRRMLLAEFAEEQESRVQWLTADDIYDVSGPMDGTDLMTLTAIDMPAIKDPPYHPVTPARMAGARDLFEVIREADVLVHHPFENFATTVERFILAAVDDPNVLAIKLTLYRTGGDSSIARAMLHAAERGKQVAVLIELQARFDEESNIIWAQRLEDVGVHVSYGVAGLKTHGKVVLVVRREGDGLRRYVHLGTGNYNPKTARLYTDFGLFTANPEIGADLSDLFNVLTGFGSPSGYRRLIVAPRGMRDDFIKLIRREIFHAKEGRPARILAKMNALVDPDMIMALYEASQAGVIVDLIVRGICCLKPGLPGVSDNIRVISVVGRFLEHSRAYYFLNGGQEEVFISSADWMPRNLDRRIEVAAPIDDLHHRIVIRDTMELLWRDNRQAWDLNSDGQYTQRIPPTPEEERATHKTLIGMYHDGVGV